jgi:cytochrome c oxidase assembly protein subunit 11
MNERVASLWLSKKARWVLALSTVVVMMLGLVAWSPELYRIFCDVTGYGGGTQRSVDDFASLKSTSKVASGDEAGDGDGALLPEVTVYFDANTDKRLPWKFFPEQRSVKVRVGEPKQIFYRAYNHSSHRIVGQATFNVVPFLLGSYFYKAECFCFDKQVLEPGQEARMPVVFYLEKDMLEDEETESMREVTLSYTFYRLKDLEESGEMMDHGDHGDHGSHEGHGEDADMHNLKDTGRKRKESLDKGEDQDFAPAGVRRS